MKLKLISLIAVAVTLLAGVFWYVRGRDNMAPEKEAIAGFLEHFGRHVERNQVDSLLLFFDEQDRGQAKRLIELLTGTRDFNSDDKPLAAIALQIEDAGIVVETDHTVTASIPAVFSNDVIDPRKSVLILKIGRKARGGYRIIQVDARKFLGDYVAYENRVRTRTLTDADIYSPITLAAFKTAETLKSRYDSVVWFAHQEGKTWYYVANKDWDEQKLNRDSTSSHKMGLVSPDLVEIIPVEYSLVHAIGGTFPDMIEVEKEGKRGFYDIRGKLVIPIAYEHIYPVNSPDGIAVLTTGNDFYWLRSDYTITEKVDLKIGDVLAMLRQVPSFTLSHATPDNLIEYNSREYHGSIYLSPSYLVDLNFVNPVIPFENPLRKKIQYEFVSSNYVVKPTTVTSKRGVDWLQAAAYSIRDYFLGGRTEFYDRKNIVVIDKRNNRLLTANISINDEGMGEMNCDEPVSFRAVNDSLFEVRSSGGYYDLALYDTSRSVSGGRQYHYFAVKGNKLVELTGNRWFSFTKYTRIDDSYLEGCFEYATVTKDDIKYSTGSVNTELLQFIKNDIYADYAYAFKDKRWAEIMEGGNAYYTRGQGDVKHYCENVNDSLTRIDRYNIDFINRKLSKFGKADKVAKR